MNVLAVGRWQRWGLLVALGLGYAGLGLAAEPAPGTVRVATYNVALNRPKAGQLARDLATGTDAQAWAVARVLRRVRPNIVLLNEVDYDVAGAAIIALCRRYLENESEAAAGLAPLAYPYRFWAPVNTGVDSGLDLNSDGKLGTPADAWGWGSHPGQYGMVVLSQYPIDLGGVRTFRHFRWADLPGAQAPLLPDGSPYYPAEVWTQLRLSSKSHWCVPIALGDRTLHLLASHPTPPVFDGPEDRNGARNADEIRFWSLFLDESPALLDDQARSGGLPAEEEFVLVGDLNADPADGDGQRAVIAALLAHPRVFDPRPSSVGAVQAERLGSPPIGPLELQTGDFEEPVPGNLRIDYVLPSVGLPALASGVHWPAVDDPTADDAAKASDHRLVWVDVSLHPR